MGIDARMLIRGVPASLVTDEWLKAISWRLCQSIGAKNFFISDGLPPAEFEAAYDKWSKVFDAHPRCRRNAEGHYAFADGDHEAIIKDIGEAPKEQRTAIRKAECWLFEGDAREEPWPLGAAYNHSYGEVVEAESDECLLSVSLWGRYYGPGYERGDPLIYCAIAEWLELNIPGCTVYYGGDCDGPMEVFDADARLTLRQHLYSLQGRAYFTGFADGSNAKPPACSLCPNNTYCGYQTGSGLNGFAAFYCRGCDCFTSTPDGGKTWERKES